MITSNDKSFKWIVLFYTLAIVTICVLSSIVFVKCNNKETVTTQIEHVTDTVVKRQTDSVYIDHYYKLPGRIDTVFVFNKTDSILITGYAKDTIVIEKFELQTIIHDTLIRDTVFITKTIDKQIKHFGFGFQLGFAAIYGLNSKKFDCGPSVGIGVIYKF